MVVPTLAHKFFETDLPFGLVTFIDIARMVNVDTPVMEEVSGGGGRREATS